MNPTPTTTLFEYSLVRTCVTPVGQAGVMTSQLLLFPETAARPPASGRRNVRPAWMLDEKTREIGRRRVAEARAILRVRQRTAEPPSPAPAQPAA